MISKPILSISIDGVGVTIKDLQEVSMYSSIDMTLPELTFKLEDTGGCRTSSFSIYIGAIVNVTLLEMNTNLDGNPKGYGYMQFVVTKVFNGFEHNDAVMSGFLQVWCKPSWYLFGSYQGHAYPPMKLSELIKKVCQDSNTSTKMIVKDENFAASSDPGNVPRYKCGESDIDFIEQKLLPYTNIDDSNVFFYVDWFNNPHLTSFARMIGQQEKVIAMPPQGYSGTIAKTAREIMDKKGIQEGFCWTDIKLVIGNSDIRKAFATLKKRVIFENNETGKVYVANQQPKAKIGKDNPPKAYNAKMPISAISMEYIEATSSEAYPNRLLPDALALARNSDNDIIDFIQVELTADGIINGALPGDTLYLLPPLQKDTSPDASEEDVKKCVHWLTGKWLIKDIQYSQIDGNSEKAVTVINIVRPTITFSRDNTTISNPSYFYTVD